VPTALRKLSLVFLVAALAMSAHAATLTTAAGAITATARTEDFATASGFDIRGTALLEIFDPASLGFVIVSDGGAAAPNSVLIGTDGGTEFVTMTFNTAAPFVSTDLVTVLFAAEVEPVGAVTNPALSAFLGNWIVTMSLTSVVPDEVVPSAVAGATLGYDAIAYREIEATVPEPASVLMAIGGFAALALARRFRHR